MDVVRRILDLTGAIARPRPPRRRPPRPRPALLGRLEQAQRARLDAEALVRQRRPRGDRRLVPREPRLVGADQVRRLHARTTTSSTPLGSRSVAVTAALLRGLPQPVDLLALALDRLASGRAASRRRCSCRARSACTRGCSGVGLGRAARAGQLLHRLLEQRQRAREVARLDLREARVVQRRAARRRSRPSSWRGGVVVEARRRCGRDGLVHGRALARDGLDDRPRPGLRRRRRRRRRASRGPRRAMPAATSSATSAGIHQREPPPPAQDACVAAVAGARPLDPRVAGVVVQRPPQVADELRRRRIATRGLLRERPLEDRVDRGRQGAVRLVQRRDRSASRGRPPRRSASRPGTAACPRAAPTRRSRARTGRSPAPARSPRACSGDR